MAPERPLGMGCMRLSTQSDRDDARAIDLLHGAFDAGVTFLDTADAYCLDDSETGHNERLIARALSSWNGDRSRIIVATKGGLTRPGGEWVATGRARHLRAACEASLRALAVERIGLYQLHALDPKTPLATSVRALASLKEDGLVERIGLCNVTVGQIEEARHITDISAVQVELSVWHDENVLNGVVGHCAMHGIQLIAYRPLGGSRRVRRTLSDPVLADIARRHGATGAEIALAWLATLSDHIVTIPGATRIETVQSIVRAHGVQLSVDDREQLDRRFRMGGSQDPPLRTRSDRRGGSSDPRKDSEVVLIMGLPGAGKSTVAREYVERGYVRLNRDEAGGSLRDLLPALEESISNGASKIVLDNTYVSRASRALVVHAAQALGLPVRCVWLDTSVEDAQVNAVSRIIANHGRLLGPEEMKQAVKRDVSAFAPTVQFRHRRELEPPAPAEGFSRIDIVPFERTRDPAMTNKALIVCCDGTLVGDVAADCQIRRADVLRRYRDEGWLLLGIAWRPQIADRTMTSEQVEADFARMQEQLGVAIEVLYCPHAAGPPTCWCRKPLPGLGVVLIQRHRLDPSRCVYVGSGPHDQGFARRLGFEYRDASDFLDAS
jgi:aryl-alcohol dehydrogenase-like predicted oxidoreductase/predicted kinase/histidinol phosphatase-like enzyme